MAMVTAKAMIVTIVMVIMTMATSVIETTTRMSI